MPANTRDIRRRIRSVKNTAQITRAMQLVAASKMKKAQDRALAGRPYILMLGQLLEKVSARGADLPVDHLFLTKREVKTRGIIVLSTEKGLCGGLNANLFRELMLIKGPAKFITMGRKARQFLSQTRRDLIADFTVSDNAPFSEVQPIFDTAVEAFEKGEIDTVEVYFSRFINTLKQVPRSFQLLPIRGMDQILEEVREKSGVSDLPEDNRELHFEPSAQEILTELLPLYLKKSLYELVLDSRASEHSARMVAMKTATDNAKNLVGELTLLYNKARQTAITQEILEIAAATASTQN